MHSDLLMDSQPKVTKELFNSVDEATVNFGVLKQSNEGSQCLCRVP